MLLQRVSSMDVVKLTIKQLLDLFNHSNKSKWSVFRNVRIHSFWKFIFRWTCITHSISIQASAGKYVSTWKRVIGVLTWICHFRSFSSRYTGERCERLVPSKAGLDWLWALLGISILLVAILTILLTRKKHQNQKKKMKNKSGILLAEQTPNNNIDHQDQNEHTDEQNAVESEHIELNNRNSENLIPE